MGGRKELLEKLGRNDPCICGSGTQISNTAACSAANSTAPIATTSFGKAIDTWCKTPNKQLQRTVPRYRERAASASFHCALRGALHTRACRR